MNGFIIVDLIKGQLVFEKDYSPEGGFGFSEPFDKMEPEAEANIGKQNAIYNDPMNLASYFFANIKLVDIMVEEVKSTNPNID